MNAYRAQQLAAAALIDSGDYTAEQIAIIYGWIKHKPPERAAPERSGATGYKKALTAPRKCGIIKAIRRYVRCWKQKKEGKTMKRTEAQELAAKIAAADTWNENDCQKLCELAGMLVEWNAADGETFETVVYNAAEKLGVEI